MDEGRKLGGKDPAKNLKPNEWMVHGKKFNLTKFVDNHPGGTRTINMGRGRDCTELFESYHPHGDKQWATLKKYEVVEDG
jgi:cytochrome b involved in lipid metabolism